MTAPPIISDIIDTTFGVLTNSGMPTPKVARNLGTLNFHRYRENRRISTIRFQTLKYTQGNYVRHFWGTTPATPAARGSAPLTRRYTHYEAVHPLRGTAPEQKGCNAYGSGAAHKNTRQNADSARRLGGGAWPDNAPSNTATKAPQVWKAPEGPEGTGGLRGAAPNDVRPSSLAGGRALRRPEHPWGHKQHQAAGAARGRPGPPAQHGRKRQTT